MASLFLLAASLSILMYFCQADLIADICGQSEIITPSYCAQTLRSALHSHHADLDSLGQISIKKAKVAVKNTATVAKAVQDMNNTGAVSVCRQVCKSAIEELNTSSETLKNMGDRSKGDLPIILSGAMTLVGTCDDAFEENAEGMPPEVKEASRIARGLIYVVLIIANMP